ncbi:hypothetical protein D3C79_822740 [compost metagenome]
MFMQAVTEAPYRFNIVLYRIGLFQLITQIAHMSLDGIVITEIFISPDRFIQVGFRENFAPVQHQQFENMIFLCRQIEVDFSYCYPLRTAIQYQILIAEQLAVLKLLTGTAQIGFHAGQGFS